MRKHHRLALAGLPSALIAAGSTLFQPVTAAAPTPNLVVIVSDDLSLAMLNDGIASGWMPNLKNHIIDSGTTFANAFVTDSVCCPSRASMLTGQHSHNHHVLSNDLLSNGGVTRLNDASTLATWLQDAGYRNGIVGKYLNGYGQNLSPSPTDDPTYVAPGWDDWQVLLSGAVYNWSLNDNGTIVTYGSQPADYQTDVLAQRTADFIEESDDQDDGQPFFLWVTPGAPHVQSQPVCAMNWGTMGFSLPAPRHLGLAGALPLPQGPSFNEANVVDKPTWLKGNYPRLNQTQIGCLTTAHRSAVETMMAVDDLIGTVVATLQATGELNNTLLVFTSDNGFLLGEHRVNAKQQAYQEAIRVPLYVRAPGVAGLQTALQPTLGVDLAPTLLDLARATAGLTIDGRSFVPLLEDPATSPWRTTFLVEHKKVSSTLVADYSAVRDMQYLYVEYRNGQRELYDLAADPSELVSQHNNPGYAAIKAALRQKLIPLKSCTGNACWQ